MITRAVLLLSLLAGSSCRSADDPRPVPDSGDELERPRAIDARARPSSADADVAVAEPDGRDAADTNRSDTRSDDTAPDVATPMSEMIPDPAGVDAGGGDTRVLPPQGITCPPANQARTCRDYCACWFLLCAPMAPHSQVFSSWQQCMSTCEKFSSAELACRTYRVNNRPYTKHCNEAVPGAKCP